MSPRYLIFSFRFIGQEYHARTSNGSYPEWPPTSLRFFQAMVSTAGKLYPDFPPDVAGALEWLSSLNPPILVTPKATLASGINNYVINNNQEDHNCGSSSKIIQPYIMEGEPVVQFAWMIPEVTPEIKRYLEVLELLASQICYLGQRRSEGSGADMDLLEAYDPPSDREIWYPCPKGQEGCVADSPGKGLLTELREREQVRRTVEYDRYGNPITPRLGSIRNREETRYQRISSLSRKPVQVFNLMAPDEMSLSAWNPAREGYVVAGLVRHALKKAALEFGWSEEKVNEVVLGHGRDGNPTQGPDIQRFLIYPLPTVDTVNGKNFNHVSDIRRVLFTSTTTWDEEMEKITQRLIGAPLIDERTGEVVSILIPTSESNWVVQRYLQPSFEHVSVLPVCIPRVQSEKATLEDLVRIQMFYAGIPEVLIDHCDVDASPYRAFLPGTERPVSYIPRSSLRSYLRVHVRVTWRDHRNYPIKVPGPVCYGPGRFGGYGLSVGV